jgi:hypothetical protein
MGEFDKSLVDVCGAYPEGVIFVNTYDHSIVGIDGKPLPQALHFDYMSGCLDNRKWDLEKVMAIIETNSELEALPDRDTRAGSKPILRVPHYNADAGRSHHIHMKWTPSQETWDRLLGLMPKGTTAVGNLALADVLDRHDLFGFVEAGCRLPDRPYWEDSDDDE